MLADNTMDVISRIPALDSLGDVPPGVLRTVVEEVAAAARLADDTEAQFQNYIGDLRGRMSP
ncbi:hypothetical protein Pflav_089990 [Phytohabitans flavus]|uniref:Uncharacterized protein n=2 Tax=Phytohabitans flavus TaxID=1076124 RepID=A0A6F8Y980_9ACTN|nr:hypothetical protein Pflav_089990 [Phytohabitans flavus]